MALDISNSNIKKLNKFVKSYKRRINIIKLDNISNYFDFDYDIMGWNPIVLARLLLDELLPKKLDRILYLDGDTIVRGSLKKLWNTDMKSSSIAASIEPTVDKARKENLGILGYPYYNAGVLLVDLNNWRKNHTGKEIIDYYKDNNGKLFANDQDAINGSQKGRIFTLSPKYNYYNIFDQYSYEFLKNLTSDCKYIDKKVFDVARNKPIIIHYLGEERHWRIGNTHKYRDDYLKYLDLTPWKNNNFEEGWKLYFICWNTFNVITKPFPIIRYKIINGLIPTVMKYRSKKLIKNREK